MQTNLADFIRDTPEGSEAEEILRKNDEAVFNREQLAQARLEPFGKQYMLPLPSLAQLPPGVAVKAAARNKAAAAPQRVAPSKISAGAGLAMPRLPPLALPAG